MFGKLKDRLKQAVSIFSRKTEEEAEVVETPAEKKEIPAVKEKAQIEKKEHKKGQKKDKAAERKKTEDKISKEEAKKENIQKKEKIAEKKKESDKDIKKEKAEKKESEAIETEEPEKAEPIKEIQAPQKEERSFFKKIFGKKEEAVEIKAEETAVTEEKAEEKESFFSKVKTSLTTKTISAEKFEELFWELEVTLLENNVSVEVIEKIKEDLKVELVDKPLPRDVAGKIEDTLKKTLKEILSYEPVELLEKIKDKEGTFVIAFFGINGTGKTTSIAKLAYYFQQHKISVVLAACDTFRAAAIQQLEEHADKLGIKIIKQDYGSDAAAVAFDAVKYAEKNKIKVVLLDTAGRLHSNTNLMKELEKIIRVAKPDFKIFVGESITGNDCIEQARKFNELVEMDGAILTKADVDEKGGAPLSISYTIKKPILFLGVGQRYEDLEKFDAELILKRLGFA